MGRIDEELNKEEFNDILDDDDDSEDDPIEIIVDDDDDYDPDAEAPDLKKATETWDNQRQIERENAVLELVYKKFINIFTAADVLKTTPEAVKELQLERGFYTGVDDRTYLAALEIILQELSVNYRIIPDMMVPYGDPDAEGALCISRNHDGWHCFVLRGFELVNDIVNDEIASACILAVRRAAARVVESGWPYVQRYIDLVAGLHAQDAIHDTLVEYQILLQWLKEEDEHYHHISTHADYEHALHTTDPVVLEQIRQRTLRIILERFNINDDH